MEATIQDRIIDAATSGFARNGVMATRLEDVSRDAGASVGAIYHHFPDKRALHREAYLRALADYQAGFADVLRESEDAESGIKGIVRHHLGWVAANREAATLLLGERPSGPDAAERLADQNRALFKTIAGWWRIHARYGAVRELDEPVLFALWLGPAHAFTRHWLAGRHSRLPTGVATELADAAWASLRREPAP
jgi:AcrR family transcriptional regulator